MNSPGCPIKELLTNMSISNLSFAWSITPNFFSFWVAIKIEKC